MVSRKAALGVCALVATVASAARAQPDVERSRVPLAAPGLRVLDATLASRLDAAQAASPTLAGLVARLGRSDVIVYLRVLPQPETIRLRGRTQFVGWAGPLRLLMVTVARDGNDVRELGMLAHELRHAVEIADAGEVRSELDLVGLYERIGFRKRADHRYETEAALQVQQQVERELRLARRP